MDESLIEEARRAGQAYIDSFKGDRQAMLEDLRRRAREAGHQTVRLPPKTPRHHAVKKAS
jgi:hypothetical protein